MFLRCFLSLSKGQAAYCGLELGVSLPTGQLGSDETPAGEALVHEFLPRADLVKNNALMYFRMVPLPPLSETRGYF